MQVEVGGVRRFCERCQHSVHDLSAMDEARARAFLRATEGQRMCIAYVEDEAGELVFRSPTQPASLIPLAQVTRRPRASPTSTLASAASLAVVLSGCTPHGEAQRVIQLDDRDTASVAAPTTVIPVRAVAAPAPAQSDDASVAEAEPCEGNRRAEPTLAKKGKRKRTAGLRVPHDPL